MATIVGYYNTYVVNGATQSPPNLLDILGPGGGAFGGDYFQLNPPEYAVINGNTVNINPNANIQNLIDFGDGNGPTNTTETDINLAPQTLVGGNNNTIAGDVYSFSFNANAGIGFSIGYTDSYTAVVNTNLNMVDINGHGNTIKGGIKDTIYGNMHDLSMIAKGPNGAGGGLDYSYLTADIATTGADVEGVINNVTVSMGHNTITSGNNSSVYGDAFLVDLEAFAGGIAPTAINPLGVPGSYGSSIGQAFLGLFNGDAPIINGGYNTITVNGPNALIAGDSHTITLRATGGYDSTDQTGFNGGSITHVHIFDGHNNITATNGGVIAGSTFDVDLEAIGGTADNGRSASDSVVESRNPNGGEVKHNLGIDLSHNTIVDQGNQATTIYGSAEDVTLHAQAGTILGNGFEMGTGGNSLDALTGLNDTFTSSVEADVSGERVILGNNTIDASGSSGKDTIFGDVQTVDFTVTGGTINGSGAHAGGDAAAFVTGNSITMGGDTITGGSGTDVIYGNAQSVDFTHTDGTNSAGINGNAGGYFSGILPYQDPTAVAFNAAYQANGVNPLGLIDPGNILTFNGDTITAGSGNTTIYSHVGSFNGLGDFLNGGNLHIDVNNPNSITNNNQVIFGNDTLTGGSGHDTFVFDLMNIGNNGNPFVMQGSSVGHNEITNFTVGKDTLEFDGLTMSQLMADATITNVAGGTVIEFGSYTKTIGVQQFYNSTNDGGDSNLDGYSIYAKAGTANADLNNPANWVNSTVTNGSFPTPTEVSGAPGAVKDIVYSTETVHGSLILDGVHLAHDTVSGLISALGATHVVTH